MKNNHLVLDFDGVLLNSHSAALMTHMRIDGVSLQEAMQISQTYCSLPHTQHQDVKIIGHDEMERKREFSKDILENATLFTPFIDELINIPFENIAIVSSGLRDYIEHFAQQIPIKFRDIITFETFPCKKEAILYLEKDWQINASDMIFFTDTPGDIIALRDIVGKIYGCCWGYAGEEILSKHLDEPYLLREFCDIRKIF
jgi:FMN phosphatase YigB (HAD superfamily)